MPDADSTSELTAVLGVELDPDLLRMALTHRSYAYENGGLPTNERLEFLGDSVLGIVVTNSLYTGHPDAPEGHLARLRSSVVNMRALARVARDLDLGRHLLLGRGETVTGGADKDSILGDAVEALIGAVYVGFGTEVAAELVHRLIDPLLAEAERLGAGLDWKTSLQEVTAAGTLGPPVYTLVSTGPDHAKVFTATVSVDGAPLGEGTGSTKKQAEQIAAQTAYLTLVPPPPPPPTPTPAPAP